MDKQIVPSRQLSLGQRNSLQGKQYIAQRLLLIHPALLSSSNVRDRCDIEDASQIFGREI